MEKKNTVIMGIFAAAILISLFLLILFSVRRNPMQIVPAETMPETVITTAVSAAQTTDEPFHKTTTRIVTDRSPQYTRSKSNTSTTVTTAVTGMTGETDETGKTASTNTTETHTGTGSSADVQAQISEINAKYESLIAQQQSTIDSCMASADYNPSLVGQSAAEYQNLAAGAESRAVQCESSGDTEGAAAARAEAEQYRASARRIEAANSCQSRINAARQNIESLQAQWQAELSAIS